MKRRFLWMAAAIALLSPAVLAQEFPPAGYPADYAAIVEASKQENALLVYSNMAANNWAPVIEGFNSHFPWIGVETLDLGSGEVFSRYEAEAGTGAATADLLVSGANDRWAAFGVAGTMLDYQSPEFANLPEFARPFAGVTVVSTDPLVIVYNTALVPEDQRPTGWASFVANAAADPATFEGRLTTYDAAKNAFGLAAWYYLLREKGEQGWADLASIGPLIRAETSGGAMNEKITTGEYLAGFNISGITIFPRLEAPGGEILGFAFPDDGVPLMLRGMGITKQGAHPNAAKLFFDYLLTPEGQTLLGKGGVIPYRDEVVEADVRYTYQAIVDLVGDANIIRVGFDEALINDAGPFAERFTQALMGN